MTFKLHYKTPLPIVLSLLVNLVLIIALEVLLVYRCPAQLSSSDLAKIDPNFENCTILMNDTVNREQFFLARTQTGRQYVIPTRTHPFFWNRCRVYEKEIKEVDDRVGTMAYRLGMRLYHVTAYPDYLLVTSSGGHTGQQTTMMYYLCLSGFLTLTELGILEKIKAV